MRAEVAGLILCALLAACGVGARFVRPEGDGGWTDTRRAEEVARSTAIHAAPSATPLTLAAALALADAGNPRIAEAENELDEARERVWQARGRLFPRTTGSGRYTWYTDPQRVTVPAGVRIPGFSGITIREAEVGNVNGTLTLPLDVTGELTQALSAAQAGYRGERARVWATRLEEHVLVVRSYFALLEAERLREVTRQTIATDRQQLENAHRRFDAGRLTKNELLVVDVAVRNAEQRLLERDLAIDQARWALNQATGLPVDAPSEIADVHERPTLPDLDDALRIARAENPAVIAVLEEQQRLEASTRALERGWLPRLSTGGTVDYTTQTIVQPQTIGGGFVGFDWDLGTDTRRAAEIAEARLAADRNRRRLERELRALEAAIRGAHRATEERLAALGAAEAGVGQAEENLRIRQDQFAAGRATTDDVLDAEALLAAERATLAGALYQAHTRRAELQQLMGRPLDDVVAEAR